MARKPETFTPEYLYKTLEQVFPELSADDSADWSQKILMFLALAHYAANRLKTLSNKTALTFSNRELIIPSLERSWREALHVRLHLPDLGEPQDKVSLTRFGHIDKADRN